MTETALEDAVRRLERAIVRLEQQPRPLAPQPDNEALDRLERRHAQLRTRVEEAVRSLDRLIGDEG